MTATAVASGVACGDAATPGGNTVPTADLVVLRQSANADPPGQISFLVPNRIVTERTLRHPDAFNTAYLTIRFPSGSLSVLNGVPLTLADTVRITLEPRTGEYGFTLSPSGLEFTLSNTPTVEFSYGLYGDLSVANGIAAFPTRAAYGEALEIWEEVTIGQWRVARGSSSVGIDAVGSGEKPRSSRPSFVPGTVKPHSSK